MPTWKDDTAVQSEQLNMGLDIDPRIDLTKSIWEQAKALWAIDEAEDATLAISEALKPHMTASDDLTLWHAVLRMVLMDLRAMDDEDDLPAKQFLKIGCCSHWFRPHQARWAAGGGFAWPSGWHGVSGYATGGLPEFDWYELFEKVGGVWKSASKFSGKDRVEIRVSVPARSAKHAQAAIHTLWSPMNNKVFYGFRKQDDAWKIAARSDFYGGDHTS